MKKLILIALFTLGYSILLAQSIYKEEKQLAHDMATMLLKTAKLPGLSIAILKDGKIIYAEGFGYANLEEHIKVTTKTQFRTASVGKVITATALGKLMQEGKLELNAAVQKYVPYFPVKEYPITLKQLAGHLSGLPHYNNNDKLDSRFYPSVKDGLTVFEHELLLAKPGTSYTYSTHGFTLLSAAIEGASRNDFLQYMQKEVFEPLGMDQTGPDLRQQISKNKAILYDMDKGFAEKEKDPEDPSYKWAGGGFISTPIDLVKMAGGYFNGFLQQQTVDTLFKSQKLNSGQETRVGIGWRISQDVDGRSVRDHAGSMGGARSVICIYPEEKLSIAIMTNANWPSMIEETAQLIALPFLAKMETKSYPKGEFNLSISVVNGSNAETISKGKLVLNKGGGTLFTAAGFKEELAMSIIYLGKNRFAWIRPDAVCYLEIDWEDKKLWGKAIAFGSRLNHNPLDNPPFFKFSSVE
jgi:serine beta-lactamase-like protein LACTB